MQVGLVLFASSLEHTCQGYDAPGISRHQVISLLGGPASRGPATLAHLNCEGPGPGIKSCSASQPLHSPSTARYAATLDLSFALTPEKRQGVVGLCEVRQP